MSGSLRAYAVDLVRLRALLEGGSSTDPEIGEEDVERLRRSVAGKGSSGPEALEDLERVCARIGTRLSSSAFETTKLEYLDRADEAFPESVRGRGMTSAALLRSGSPFRLLRSEGFPMVGHLERQQVDAWLRVFEEESPEAQDPDADQALVDLQNWVTLASARGAGIVAFYD